MGAKMRKQNAKTQRAAEQINRPTPTVIIEGRKSSFSWIGAVSRFVCRLSSFWVGLLGLGKERSA